MKKIFFGLLVAIIAMVGSAFVNVKKKTSTIYYYYVMDNDIGRYVKFGTSSPNEGSCQTTYLFSCVICFDSYQGESINPNNLPAIPVYKSVTKGYYVPD